MALKRLDHVQLMIPKGAEDAARRFYVQLLGLREVEKPEALKKRGGLWLQLGENQVHLGVEEGLAKITTRAHVAFEVEDGSLEAMRARLTEAGVETITGDQPEGMRRFELRDPFGNRIELLERID